MTPTNVKSLRASVVARIEALTPELRPEYPFRWMRGPVDGADPRSFHVMFSEPELAVGGPFGGGMPYTTNMVVMVSYAGIPIDDEELLFDVDSRQVYRDLVLATDPTITGLVSLSHPSFSFDEENGERTASISFPIMFFGNDGGI
jgi:hypothetical protein